MRDLAALLAHLPFGLDDTEAAGRAFAAGRVGDARAKRDADLWAYVWAKRYVLRAFATERVGEASDVDAVEERIMRGVARAAERVEDPLKFPNYVSVVCKRALLTHRERRRAFVEADDVTVEPVYDDAPHAGDAAVLRQDVAVAVEALPPAVREVARMKHLEGLTFEQIAEATGHPVPTVRTYVSKANARLVASPHLRAHVYDDVLPPGALDP